MRYTVVWEREAQQDLAAIWVDAVDRQAIASAANTIDSLLREDAHLQGESRFGSVRILFVPPLGVDFEALQDDRMARVAAVWVAGGGRASGAL